MPPKQRFDYNCRMLVKIESVFFNNKDNKDDIVYYPQVFLEEGTCSPMNNRRLLLDNLDLSDNDLDSESECGEEFNENSGK